MQKILSVTLIVVMLAALITVFPASAVVAVTLPELLITELVVDTGGWSQSGSDGGDAYEFIEVVNTSDSTINLYEWSLVYADATLGADPAGKTIKKVNPIQSPADSPNDFGTIGTSAQADNDPSMYVKNPAEAKLGPGQTAVIWLYTFDAYSAAKYAKGAALTFDEFKEYHRIDKYSEDALKNIVFVAVDANGSNSTTGNTYLPNGTKITNCAYRGANNATNDRTKFNGRFNGANSGYRVYGLIKTENIVVDDNKAPQTTIGECVSYMTVNYKDGDATKNLQYKHNQLWGNTATGSTADVSYNFIYTDAASKYQIGKAAGNIKFGDWDRMNFATPGLLLSSQMANMQANGATISDDLAYIQNRVITDETSIRYIVYQENFFGMPNTEPIVYDPSNVDKYKTDTQAFFDEMNLGWEMTTFLSNGGTVRYYIENEKLVCDNLDVDLSGDGAINTADGDIDSTDALVVAYPSLSMEKVARSDYTIEYEVTYLDANENNRYCGVIYNFNGKTSYDIFILRVNGSGNNQRRIAGGHYTTYDHQTSEHNAANLDTGAATAGKSSIINKLTNGEVKVLGTKVDMWTFDEAQKAAYAPMLGRTLNIRIEVNQVKGPELYVNDILVSKPATYLTDPDDKNSEVAANAYWGAQTNYGEFAIGFFVSQRVKLTIDNIKVTGWVNEYTEADMLRTYNAAPNKEPATGDATIYVVVAMAVSFISLAALVVTKRRSSRVK
jgi:hypothetical protein